ncbi:kDa vesicle transport [Chlorella sorokiniana]|uniref:Vesicle-trafficking protein SEC22b n=1 Tax=Chlorella sorokiniana TaxID=3076 RepID=A0A2P6TBW6_CHLSO|nr:kDa vesicle transport [Chlorella sorokiniana]|eukprot:PRW18383.1 kDa vesicle transport [Chlorella sorokiniana]
MVRLTLIARVRDGLPLAEGLDADKEHEMYSYKSQAKGIFKKMATSSSKPPPRMSIESGPFTFHYLVDAGDVCYLTLTEKAYPKKLAFQYLEELASEFSRLYADQIEGVTRPYAFIKFDTFIQKTKKLYLDTRTQRNIAKLNADIAEVHSIMTRNIQDVLGQGERLDRMTEMSNMLSQDAKQFAVKAKDLYHQALFRKYLPLIILVAVVLLFIIVRFVF